MDTASLFDSSITVEQIWRNCGCWLQTARNVSLEVRANQYAADLEETATNAYAGARSFPAIVLYFLRRS